MPIEIRELNIRISVAQNQKEQEQTTNAASSGEKDLPDKDELISECLEQVSEMMKNRIER